MYIGAFNYDSNEYYQVEVESAIIGALAIWEVKEAFYQEVTL